MSTMKATLNRRDFSKALAIGLGASAPVLLAAEPRKIKIGYTCLIWNVGPRTPETLEAASRDSPITKAYLEKLGYKFRA